MNPPRTILALLAVLLALAGCLRNSEQETPETAPTTGVLTEAPAPLCPTHIAQMFQDAKFSYSLAGDNVANLKLSVAQIRFPHAEGAIWRLAGKPGDPSVRVLGIGLKLEDGSLRRASVYEESALAVEVPREAREVIFFVRHPTAESNPQVKEYLSLFPECASA